MVRFIIRPAYNSEFIEVKIYIPIWLDLLFQIKLNEQIIRK